jgi:hypothetical protein
MVMFDGPAPVFPRARREDARSSHEAAALIERTGSAKAQAERVLAAVRRFPGSTSMELSRSAHIERYVTARRLPELVHAGLVSRELPGPDTEPCVVSHKRAIRWRPA